MAATVSEVLAERASVGEPPRIVVVSLSVLAHAAFLAFLIVISRPRPIPFVPVSLPVRVVSPSALVRPAASSAAPSAPPVAKPRAAIEKVEEKPKPTEKALPLPEKKLVKERKPAPSRAAAPRGPTPIAENPFVELPTAGGSPGEAGSALSFGAAVSSFDADFPFAYYVEQLQALIGANWLKPVSPAGTAVDISFHIQRSGQVTDVKIESPSGMAVYDRAAARAVYAANPLPPLPPEYRGDALGVHIRFQ